MTRLLKYYRRASLLLLNTLVAFLILNGLMHLPWSTPKTAKWKDEKRSPAATAPRPGTPKPSANRSARQMKWVDTRSFEGLSETEIDKILDDFGRLSRSGFVFQPYTHFAEPAYQSETVNIQVDSQGFSYRQPAPMKAAKNLYQVFVFGGATAFGWHVTDTQTIPHHLEEALKKLYRKRNIWRNVEVTNFGKGYYSWFQEMILFQRLLHAGYRPDAVVFIDGVNVLYADSPNEVPYRTHELVKLWDRSQIFSTLLPTQLPLFRLINDFAKESYRQVFKEFEQDRHPRRRTYSLPDWVRKTQQSYLTTLDEIEALAKLYKIEPYFVWQPNRAYLCQSSKYRTPLPEVYREKMVPLYSEMKLLKRQNYSFLGDLCRKLGFAKRIFVDDVHYSPDFNRVIGYEIAGLMK